MSITLSKPEYQRTTEDWEVYILELGETLMEKHGLLEQDWTIKFIDEDKNNAGYCWPRGRLIFLTRELLLDTDERNVEETILHEIAHALTTVEHNKEWHDKLMEIGGTGIWHRADGTTATAPYKD